jgi:predicted nucleotidyltransferase component of viral defense system
MLHEKTVEPLTLSLIKSLQEKSYLKDFLLVGGTALALQLGHRISVDIDLFTNKRFEPEELLLQLQSDYPLIVRNRMNHALLLEIDKIKTDFVFQPSEQILPPLFMGGVKMASTLEIAAMKISAITARGKKRDFVDLFVMLNKHSLMEIMEAFLKKYPSATMELAMRSIFYFEDAESDIDPRCFFDFNWETVKIKIKTEAAKL